MPLHQSMTFITRLYIVSMVHCSLGPGMSHVELFHIVISGHATGCIACGQQGQIRGHHLLIPRTTIWQLLEDYHLSAWGRIISLSFKQCMFHPAGQRNNCMGYRQRPAPAPPGGGGVHMTITMQDAAWARPAASSASDMAACCLHVMRPCKCALGGHMHCSWRPSPSTLPCRSGFRMSKTAPCRSNVCWSKMKARIHCEP